MLSTEQLAVLGIAAQVLEEQWQPAAQGLVVNGQPVPVLIQQQVLLIGEGDDQAEVRFTWQDQRNAFGIQIT